MKSPSSNPDVRAKRQVNELKYQWNKINNVIQFNFHDESNWFEKLFIFIYESWMEKNKEIFYSEQKRDTYIYICISTHSLFLLRENM